MLKLRVLRVDLPFGREVGCSVQEILKDETKQKFLQNALLEHGLLLFRSQTLSPQEEVKLAELFPYDDECSVLDKAGPYPFQPNAIRWTLPSYPIRIQGTAKIESHHGVQDGELKTNILAREWHTDGLHDVPSTTLPPVYTSMYCYRTPSTGGETLFASGRVAYDNLTMAGLATRAQQVTVDYDITPRTMVPDGTRARAEQDIKSPTEKKWNWPTIIKDRSGRPSLYVAPCFSQTVYENGIPLSTEVGQQLLCAFLSAAIPFVRTEEPFPAGLNYFAHKWQPGDILLWDNRQMLHSATPSAIYEGEERMFHRIRMSSREPIVPFYSSDMVPSVPSSPATANNVAQKGTWDAAANSHKISNVPATSRVAHKRKCEHAVPS